MSTPQAVAANSFNLNDLMNKGMQEIDDLPDFITPPNGSYKVRVGCEQKVQNDKPAVQFRYELLEVVELANPAEAKPAEKSIFTETFYLNNEVGPKALKRHIKEVWDKLGGSLGECLKSIDGQVYYVTTKQRKYDSKDEVGPDGKPVKRIAFNTSGLVVG